MASVRIGRYQNSSGPGLATVGNNEQLASHTVGHSSVTHTLTSMGAWMGKYSGSPVVRLVLFWEHTSGRPGGVAGYTNPITLTGNYTGGGGGSMYTATLTKPLVVPAGHKLRVGVACTGGVAGVAMIPAGSISEPNENFYRKGISGNIPVDAEGSSVSTEGHLMIYADGETGSSGPGGGGAPGNSIPFAPEIISKGALTAGNLNPSLQFRHKDPDGNNSSKAGIEVRQKGQTSLKWEYEWNITVANNTVIPRTYAGTALTFGTTYQWRAQTWDSVGNEGPFSAWTDFVVYQANVAPNPPNILTPSGATGGVGLTPTMRMKHTDANGDSAKQARVIVRRGSSVIWDHTWNANTPDGGTIGITYAGPPLEYYTDYTWYGLVFDGTAWSQLSAIVPFHLVHANRAPHAPVPIAPLPTDAQFPGEIVNFRWKFTDPDAALPGMANWEATDSVRVIVRNITDNHVHWNSNWISTHNLSGSDIEVFNAAPPFAYNKVYQFEYGHRDRRLATAAITVGRVTFTPGGKVAKPTQPSGHILNYANPGQIKAVYNDPAGSAATAVQVRLVNEEGQQVAYTTMADRAIPNGSTITINWGDLVWASGSGVLPHSSRRGLQVRVRHAASGGAPTDWSPTSWLDANHPPGVPDPYSPAHESAFATKPVLVALVTDRDHSPANLTVRFQIATEPTFASPVVTTAGTFTAGGTSPGNRGRFEFDTSAAALVKGTTYYWRAYATDGTLWSGGTTSEEVSATYGTPRMFIYDDVPEVTITSPTTIATMSPTITWTTSQTQLRYRVVLSDNDGVVVYDSGIVEGSGNQHQVTGSGWLDDNQWNNEETLTAVVSVWNNLKGDSAPVAITLQYTYPDTPTMVEAEAVTPAGHVGTTVIRVTHDPTTYEEGVFSRFKYYRSELTGPDGDVIDGTRFLLSSSNTPSAPALEDWSVESGKWYRYEASQTTISGVDEIESPTVAVDAMAQWYGVVLHLPYQPDLYNIHFRWSPPDGSYEPARSIAHRSTGILGINAKRRISSIGRSRDTTVTGSFAVFDDEEADYTGSQMIERFEDLLDCADGINSPDGRPHIVCWREGRGGRHSVTYGTFGGDTGIQVYGDFDDEWIVSFEINDATMVLGETD